MLSSSQITGFFEHQYLQKEMIYLLPYLSPTHPRRGRGHIVPPCRFFDRSLLTGRALKFILYDFSSNFVLNMGPVTFFDQSNNLPTPACLSVTVNDCRL